MTEGLHENIPSETYHALEAASASRLKTLKRSAAHLRWSLDNPEQTPAMAFGEAVHCLTLQQKVFFETYMEPPECDRRTKEGKALWQAFCELSVGKKIIKTEDTNLAAAMAQAVTRHPTAGQLLASPGPVEVSGVWRDGKSGQLCKLRADKLAPEFSTIVDLKTTDDASPDGFERSILKYGYARQAAFYLHGMAQLGQAFEHFCFVCVESSPPHAVAVYRLDDEAIQVGWAECQELLERYAECVRTGRWPAYEERVQTISLPSWYLKRSLDGVAV